MYIFAFLLMVLETFISVNFLETGPEGGNRINRTSALSVTHTKVRTLLSCCPPHQSHRMCVGEDFVFCR